MTETLPPFGIGRLPRITFGAGRFSEVPAIVASHGSSVLLVSGGRSFAASPRRAELEQGLKVAGVKLAGIVSASGEPSPEDIDRALQRYRDTDVEVVLGVGGGSVLDTAKAIAGLLRSGTELLDHLEGVGRGLPYPGPALPVVAVPTTAGTGSEATRNAVISSRGPDGYKRSSRDEQLVPADAVVDPDLLAGAPPELIAANGLDALTQLIESTTSQRATPFTDGLARSGLLSVREGLLAWHADPDGEAAPAARSHMAYAALLSGICLANAGLGAVHGLASPLGAQLPIPHGMACGAVLWQTMRSNIEALTERDPGAPAMHRYAELGRLLADQPAGVDDEEGRTALIDTLRAWTKQLKVPGLSSFGMLADDIPAVVADSPGSSMRTNPIALTDQELTDILSDAL
ncbi:MAG: iron-containing alcohol dehydrogenase [Chloroflexota bacterium]